MELGIASKMCKHTKEGIEHKDTLFKKVKHQYRLSNPSCARGKVACQGNVKTNKCIEVGIGVCVQFRSLRSLAHIRGSINISWNEVFESRTRN